MSKHPEFKNYELQSHKSIENPNSINLKSIKKRGVL